MTITAQANGLHEDLALARVRDLSVSYRAGQRDVPVLSDVSLSVSEGEALALVGESGSGKSTLAAALLGHLRPGSRVGSGSVLLGGRDIFAASVSERRRMLVGTVAFVPQNAGHALTPSMRVGQQVMEVLRFGRGMDKRAAREEAVRLFGLVRLPEPCVLVDRYPHQLSGGQQQRVAIAIAVASNPKLLVMDEPTTGLDVVTQAGILSLLDDLRAELNLGLVLVSHDLAVVASVCDRVAVMYAGRVIETGPVAPTFRSPSHPYTRGLLATMPRLDEPGLPAGMPGSPAAPGLDVTGCSFADRCSFAQPECTGGPHPALAPVPGDSLERQSACLRADDVLSAPLEASRMRRRTVGDRGDLLLRVRGLEVDYRRHADPDTGPTVSDVGFDVHRGEVLALVGESGSGKSTVAWTVAGLRRPSAGEIQLHTHGPAQAGHGADPADLTGPASRRSPDTRRQVQLVFQNPDTSLNPRRTVGDAVSRPLRLFGLARARLQLRQRRDAVLTDVGLDALHAERLPGQLSGGQRQRVGIARAIAAEPALVLADEVVSALDVSVQASVLRLMDDLRDEHDLAYLFISHDLAVVRGIADRVIVLYLGRICEEGPVSRVFQGPNHPYTRMLVDAVLELHPAGERPASPGVDEPESAPPARGCAFARRCARRIDGLCETITPPWLQLEDGHRIRCHLPITELESAQP
jgi:peptide/nickel transport system ATP-binding protein